MPEMTPRTFVEGLEALGYEIVAYGTGRELRWGWGRPEGIGSEPELHPLLAWVNGDDANSKAVLGYLMESGRYKRAA